MRFRALGVVVAAVLAVAGLAGCQTNVGTAAWVDGSRITESNVNGYLTPKAQPVSGQSGQISPRSFILAELINERLGFKIAGQIPQLKNLTRAQLDARLTRDLQGKTPRAFAESHGVKGYTDDFYQILLRVQELQNVISLAAQNGVDVQKILKTLDFPVTVSPRYGHWNEKQLSLVGGARMPPYLTVQPGAANQGTG